MDSNSDFQDAVILMDIERPESAGICGSIDDDDDDDDDADDDDWEGGDPRIILHSASIDGETISITYSKNFATCAHIYTKPTTWWRKFNQRINFICRQGRNQVATTDMNRFGSPLSVGESIKICHGNNGNICSGPKTITGPTSGGDESEQEEKKTICHYPPGNKLNPHTLEIGSSAWPAHRAHGDLEGPCEEDSDGDTIVNSVDLCPNTYMPEPIPTEFMLFRRFALTHDNFIFRKGPRKKVGGFTLTDTRGCSCEQLVDVAEGKRAYRFGQFPRLQRQMRSLFPFYTRTARQYGCSRQLLKMVKRF